MVSGDIAFCDWHWFAEPIYTLLICKFCAKYALRGDMANRTASWPSLSAKPYKACREQEGVE